MLLSMQPWPHLQARSDIKLLQRHLLIQLGLSRGLIKQGPVWQSSPTYLSWQSGGGRGRHLYAFMRKRGCECMCDAFSNGSTHAVLVATLACLHGACGNGSMLAQLSWCARTCTHLDALASHSHSLVASRPWPGSGPCHTVWESLLYDILIPYSIFWSFDIIPDMTHKTHLWLFWKSAKSDLHKEQI